MPEALSSAPGATATVPRWPPTSCQERAGSNPGGAATTFAEYPASTGTPHELPAGTGTRCRVTE
jgi:hypothetical protein